MHRRYNPEGITQYNIVPGLMGVVLQMTMVMMTAIAMTRERERGTMENLLATPVRPLEVMVGKIVPYIVVGYVQVGMILLAAGLLFDVPMFGSAPVLMLGMMLFIAANLAIGFTFSTLARNQLQAMQMTLFFFLPSMLLSGFMFPFRGMPRWAQVIGEVFPLTHFLRIVRGILLKGASLSDTWPHLWPIALFLLAVTLLALRRYEKRWIDGCDVSFRAQAGEFATIRHSFCLRYAAMNLEQARSNMVESRSAPGRCWISGCSTPC